MAAEVATDDVWIQQEDLQQVATSNNNLTNPGKVFSRKPLKKPPLLEFEDLRYTVPLGLNRGSKQILKNVSGSFLPGSLVAIMGPSGAGKSSLLDILTGYKVTGVKGSILSDRQPRVLAAFRRISCYIQQDDRLQPLLTIQESMTLAANLKLSTEVSPKEKQRTIMEILETLGLENHLHTRASMLSGGQRKRLSIALELINNPLIMFLDEPTTGLDSSSCTQCMQLLRSLAQQGRTIVCTIHQPSASLFALFSHVYVLAEGRCIYQGANEKLVPFLDNIGLPCPPYNNPADYVIELACGDSESASNLEVVNKMVLGTENGRNITWFKNPDPLMVSISRSNLFATKSSDDDDVPTGFCNRLLAFCGAGKKIDHAVQETSQWNQIKVLLTRGYIKTKRDGTLTYMRLFVNIIVGVMLGCLFWSSGNQGSRVMENYKLLFSILIHLMMTTMMLTILTFPMEMSILLKEHFNRWYSLKSYFIATMIVELPIVTLGCIFFTVIIYVMSAQPMEWYRFLMFLLISLLVTYVAQSIGLLIGALFSVTNGTFIGPVISVPLMMFAGFGVTLRDIPKYMVPGTYLSYLRYGLEGMVLTIYGGGRETLDCNARYCHYRYPNKLLMEVAMDESEMYIDIIGLVLNVILLRVIAFFCLRWKIKSER
ncbi:ATP-binding cassette sub-family G member 1-like isoform X2 [Neocloeon triangulifer]|uniref:ATP-binding cassette sub-family G member 1-like isoform X2 n=1 Tax=Neocloeon triangulifer TaxID=2078957 RepID=UPI00286F5E4D|nr:ATP-binding cassette sub-family G member 1-like isoform X2 [Neocloeon triangulifer]